jgi:hypothetical protein
MLFCSTGQSTSVQQANAQYLRERRYDELRQSWLWFEVWCRIINKNHTNNNSNNNNKQ